MANATPRVAEQKTSDEAIVDLEGRGGGCQSTSISGLGRIPTPFVALFLAEVPFFNFVHQLSLTVSLVFRLWNTSSFVYVQLVLFTIV